MDCNSPTLLAVAKATRKRVFLVRSRREAEGKYSKREDLKKERTIPKSQEGVLEGRTGRTILKDRRRSHKTVLVKSSGRRNRKETLSMERYPEIA